MAKKKEAKTKTQLNHERRVAAAAKENAAREAHIAKEEAERLKLEQETQARLAQLTGK